MHACIPSFPLPSLILPFSPSVAPLVLLSSPSLILSLLSLAALVKDERDPCSTPSFPPPPFGDTRLTIVFVALSHPSSLCQRIPWARTRTTAVQTWSPPTRPCPPTRCPPRDRPTHSNPQLRPLRRLCLSLLLRPLGTPHPSTQRAPICSRTDS